MTRRREVVLLELYVANKNYSSWSLRPWVLLRELGVPFTERFVPFEGARSPGFRAFSPSGKVPALHDDARGLVVWDSSAIVETVAELFPQAGVWPAALPARGWARSACAEMHSGFTALRSRCSMNVGLRIRLASIPADLQQDLDRIDALWQDGLERWGGPFLAGATFTAADAFFAPVAYRIQTYHLPLSEASLAYAARLRALPSMQAWERDALAETWREPGHEAEVAGLGTVVADLRAR